MNKLPKTIEDASIQKMFISCQEYDRLKKIESEYLNLKKTNKKLLRLTINLEEEKDQLIFKLYFQMKVTMMTFLKK